ncbi:MAG: Kef-type K+ transport system membrane component KefB [Verrucomicrobiales bacterium]|jgi:Kef-type K+ transport system membrane component KefB
MELLYILLVLLIVTRLGGEIALRLGHPGLVGEIIAGIGLGVAVHQFQGSFPVLSELSDNKVFTSITDLGVFFLMLLAGMEMNPKELAQGSGKAVVVAIGGMVVPIAAGLGLAWYYVPDSEFRTAQIMFVATAMAITAIPVAVKVLLDIGQLKSESGKTIVSAALFDDILGLILLAVLTALLKTGEFPGWGGLLMLVGRVVLFFGIASVIGWFLLPRIARLFKGALIEEMEFSFLLVTGLGFSVLAEAFHLHFILGAFLAGLFFTGRTFGTKTFKMVETKVTGVSTGFLAPIFFASIGLHLDVSAFSEIPVFVCLLVLLAVGSKFFGAGICARWVGLSRNKAAAVGMGMSARGAVELIIADIALRAGLFTKPDPVPPIIASMFSAVVIMAIATTLIMPIGLKYFLKNAEEDA